MEIKALDVTTKMEITTAEANRRYDELLQFIRDSMKDGVDFGIIPGCGSKKTLFKSGAEKLANIFGLSHEFVTEGKLEDFEKGLFFYRYKCIVTQRSSGAKVAEGVGSCNSKENKYIKQDAFTVMNTIDKMAQKRAYVAAIISATRVSHEYTQDLEDGVVERKNVTELTYNCEKCKIAISKKVSEFSMDKYKKMLCLQCQNEERNKTK